MCRAGSKTGRPNALDDDELEKRLDDLPVRVRDERERNGRRRARISRGYYELAKRRDETFIPVVPIFCFVRATRVNTRRVYVTRRSSRTSRRRFATTRSPLHRPETVFVARAVRVVTET